MLKLLKHKVYNKRIIALISVNIVPRKVDILARDNIHRYEFNNLVVLTWGVQIAKLFESSPNRFHFPQTRL